MSKEVYKVPDYKIYDNIDECPKLLATQKALEAQGLKDPWIRNELWRYNPEEFGTEKKRFRMFFMRGFRIGLAATVLTVISSMAYSMVFPSKQEHGHAGADEVEKEPPPPSESQSQQSSSNDKQNDANLKEKDENCVKK